MIRRRTPCALLGLAIAIAACQADVRPSTTAIGDTLDRLEARWAVAIRDRDSLALEQILAPDFSLAGTSTSRRPVARSAWMDNAMHHLRIDTVRTWPARASVHGDTIETALSFFWAGRFDAEQPFRDSIVLTDVWVHGADGWRVHRRVVPE